jgi:hypothetical protein
VVEALKTEIDAALKNPEIRGLVGTLILGSQLYSWAHFKLFHMKQYTVDAKASIFLSANQLTIDDKGRAKAFSQDRMLQNLKDEILPFLNKAIAAVKIQPTTETPVSSAATETVIASPELRVERGATASIDADMPPVLHVERSEETTNG